MNWEHEIHQLLVTVVYAIVGFTLLGVGVLLMEKLTPFSIRKEIEEDHNVALGIIVAGAMIAIGIMVGSVIR